MSLRVLTICVLSLEVSGTLDPSYFSLGRFEKPDYFHSLCQDVMAIFANSPNTSASTVIRLISGNPQEYYLPIKLLHDNEKTIIMGQKVPVRVHSSIVEIKCQRSGSKEILERILPGVIDAYTILVIVKNPEEFYFHEIEACMLEVFEIFWKLRITNVVIMFLNNYKVSVKNSPTPLKFFTFVYEPYNEEPLRNVTGMGFRKIFYDKTANLHLHPLKILAFEGHRFYVKIGDDGTLQPAGIDGSLTKVLGKIFNATTILTYVTMAEVLQWNITVEDNIELLKNGTIDMWMNVHISSLEERGIIHSYPRERMDVICILLKNRDGHVEYKSIGGGRVRFILLTTLIVFCITSFFLFFSSKILLQNIPLLKLPKLVLNQPDVVTQRTSSTTIRVLLGTWIIFSLACSTSLQTLITSRIIRPSEDYRMKTIQEVLGSDIRLRIERTWWKMTKTHYDENMFRALLSKIDVVPNNELFNVENQNIGYMTSKDIVQFIAGRRSHVYVLKETFLPNLVAYYFPKKSSFISRFDKARMALTESGITQKWVGDNHKRLTKGLKIEKLFASTEYITFQNLISVFYVYSVGVLLAILVFICEVKFQ